MNQIYSEHSDKKAAKKMLVELEFWFSLDSTWFYLCLTDGGKKSLVIAG
jgi:hypothetical protein